MANQVNDELANSEQAQAQSASSLPAGNHKPVSDTWDATSASRLQEAAQKQLEALEACRVALGTAALVLRSVDAHQTAQLCEDATAALVSAWGAR